MISIYAKHFNPTVESRLQNGEEEALLCTIPNQNGSKPPFLTATVNDEMGTAGSFEFSIPPMQPYSEIWQHMRTMMRVEYDDQTIFFGRILTIDRDMFRTKKIHCEGALSFFMDSVFESVKKGYEMSLGEFLDKLIEAHNECMEIERINENDAIYSESKKIYAGEIPGHYTPYAYYLVVNAKNAVDLEEEEPEEDPYDITSSLWVYDRSLDDEDRVNLYDSEQLKDGFWVDSDGSLIPAEGCKVAVVPIDGIKEIGISTGDTEVDLRGHIAYVTKDMVVLKQEYRASDYKKTKIFQGGYEYRFPEVSGGITLEQQVKNDRQIYAKGEGYNTVKSFLEGLASDYGGFMRVRYNPEDQKLYLDWLKLYYNNEINNQTLSVSKNVIDLSDTVEVNNIFTYVIPIGKNNRTIDGGGGGGGGGPRTITVIMNVPHGWTQFCSASASTSKANKGDKVTLTARVSGTTQVTFTRWSGVEVKDKEEDDPVPVPIVNPTQKNTYFIMPAKSVVITATFDSPYDPGSGSGGGIIL